VPHWPPYSHGLPELGRVYGSTLDGVHNWFILTNNRRSRILRYHKSAFRPACHQNEAGLVPQHQLVGSAFRTVFAYDSCWRWPKSPMLKPVAAMKIRQIPIRIFVRENIAIVRTAIHFYCQHLGHIPYTIPCSPCTCAYSGTSTGPAHVSFSCLPNSLPSRKFSDGRALSA